jgi:hypothetical protein
MKELMWCKTIFIPKICKVFELQIGTWERFSLFNLELMLARKDFDIIHIYIELFSAYFEFRIYDTRW